MSASDLIVVAEPWQWVAIAAMSLALTAGLYAWGKDRPRPTLLLAALRMASLGILGFLLLEPMLRSVNETEEAPVLPILVDASSSQWMGADSLARKSSLAALVEGLSLWGDELGWTLELHQFDREVSPLVAWDPQGKRTNLGGAMQSMRDRYLHRNVPAMVLVTDGRTNRGPDPEFGAGKLDVPLFVIGTGDTAAIRDAELTRIRLNDVAYLDNSFPVEISVRARDLEGIPLSLGLQVNGERVPVESATWTPNKTMDSHSWSLQLDGNKPGPMTIRATVSSGKPELEASLLNNSRTETIEILESRRRVLFLARAPHPDLAALRSAAETNRHQQTEVIWLEDAMDMAVLPAHDVLVLHHLAPMSLPSALIDALEESQAVWILGDRETNWNDWDVSAVGFQLEAEPLVTEAQGLQNDEFEAFPLPTNLSQQMALWPPLACPTGQYAMTPAFQSALNQQVGPVRTTWPLWGVRKNDDLRTAMTLGEGLWRWRMQDMVRNDGASGAFDELVNRTLQFLSSRDDVKRLRIQGPDRLDEDLRCEFRAEVYDASLSLATNADVQMKLTPRGGLTTTHTFVSNGTDWVVDLGMLLPGVYDWLATCDQGGDRLSERGTLVVNAVQAEATLQPANHGLLRRLANQSQGAFLGALNESDDVAMLKAQWADKAQDIEAPRIVHSSTERLPLHLQSWLLVMLLVLLTAEWAIRRAGGGR